MEWRASDSSALRPVISLLIRQETDRRLTPVPGCARPVGSRHGMSVSRGAAFWAMIAGRLAPDVSSRAVVPPTPSSRILETMSIDASETVTITRAEFEAMQAELRRLRDALDDEIAKTRIHADSVPGPGDAARAFTRAQLAAAWEIGA